MNLMDIRPKYILKEIKFYNNVFRDQILLERVVSYVPDGVTSYRKIALYNRLSRILKRIYNQLYTNLFIMLCNSNDLVISLCYSNLQANMVL